VELRETLSDRIPDVRAAAAIALGDIGDRDAISPLWMQASEDRFEPARAAARAIAAIDPVVVAEMAERDGAGAHLAEAADRTAAGVEAR
jgi:HEAT repeat protein